MTTFFNLAFLALVLLALGAGLELIKGAPASIKVTCWVAVVVVVFWLGVM
jgi:hypothetical protein